ncbi:Glyoxalase/Bleomycin resistance protein/Dioxygenase superfamily [Prauserella sp. Am3]|nr:Glyoxalase/Bleomycin resistance protein/Dioxygenase superfamily [Prauserella sp. Am3]
MTRGALHHLELWVDDLDVAEREWGWLLGELGYECADRWRAGQSWRHPEAGYVVLEAGPDRRAGGHDRMRAGLNHVALWAGTRADVDRLAAEAPGHGWRLLFADRHPYAGGPHHYAAFVENSEGFEVELVAGPEAAHADITPPTG